MEKVQNLNVACELHAATSWDAGGAQQRFESNGTTRTFLMNATECLFSI